MYMSLINQNVTYCYVGYDPVIFAVYNVKM
jgi:hypothetical protein